jgi:hypothetical protein
MLELADIFRQYGPAYIKKYGDRMLPSHRRVIQDIINCRTPALGGQVYECKDCKEIDYSYHSCMNRHCPKCMNTQADEWIEKERQRLLPVPYFLITFPLPKELRKAARSHQKTIYNIAIKAAAQAMQVLARDPKRLGGEIGLLGILHTWKRNLDFHPHVHFLAPGGAISSDKRHWTRTKYKFFLPIRALSKIFRAKFRDALKEADMDLFKTIPPQVWHKDWVVHCEPAGTGKEVLKYMAPYIYRVAISNKNLLKLENDLVTFKYKHSKTKEWQIRTLPVFEFMHVFLQHVLPRGFKKVRHYGFLSSRHKLTLALLQYMLGTVEWKPGEQPLKQDYKHLCPQ